MKFEAKLHASLLILEMCHLSSCRNCRKTSNTEAQKPHMKKLCTFYPITWHTASNKAVKLSLKAQVCIRLLSSSFWQPNFMFTSSRTWVRLHHHVAQLYANCQSSKVPCFQIPFSGPHPSFLVYLLALLSTSNCWTHFTWSF